MAPDLHERIFGARTQPAEDWTMQEEIDAQKALAERYRQERDRAVEELNGVRSENHTDGQYSLRVLELQEANAEIDRLRKAGQESSEKWRKAAHETQQQWENGLREKLVDLRERSEISPSAAQEIANGAGIDLRQKFQATVLVSYNVVVMAETEEEAREYISSNDDGTTTVFSWDDFGDFESDNPIQFLEAVDVDVPDFGRAED